MNTWACMCLQTQVCMPKKVDAYLGLEALTCVQTQVCMPKKASTFLEGDEGDRGEGHRRKKE